MSFQFELRFFGSKSDFHLCFRFTLLDKGSLDKFRFDWVMLVKAFCGNNMKTEEIRLQVVHTPGRTTAKDSPTKTSAASSSTENNVTSESGDNQVY